MKMDFQLTENQRMIRDMVREFCEKEIVPVAAELDRKGEFPHDIVQKLAALGLMGMTSPVEYGGAGIDTVSYSLAVEEISKASGSVGITVAAHNSLGTSHILDQGTEEQKRKYIPGLASGKGLGAWCLTEASAGSDAAGILTTAVKKGNEWVINGSKMFITNTYVSDVYTVMAVTDKAKGAKGITAFIVEKDNPGLKMGKKEDKMGLRASMTSEILLEDCRVPQENVLGKEGMGFIGAMRTLDGGRISIGSMALGIGRAAYETALRYSMERKAFGKTLSNFQAIQWMLADMATELDAATLLIRRAAWMKDQKMEFTKEASMAKLFASEAASRACNKAIQIHGGYGYSREYPLERFLRDAKLCEIGEGTSEVQRMVIAKNILK